MCIRDRLSVYRKKTIDKYNKLIEENNKKIEELAAKKVSLNKLESELEVQLSKLGDELSSISEASLTIEEEIEGLKKDIKLNEEKYKCSNDEDLDVCKTRYFNSQNQNNSSGSSSGSGTINWDKSGIYRPVASARINANYGYSSIYGSTYHYGIDIGVSHGTPVYSIAVGLVSKITYKANCGGNMLYISYITDSGQRFTAGYFHLSSITVSEGDIVNPNTCLLYTSDAADD